MYGWEKFLKILQKQPTRDISLLRQLAFLCKRVGDHSMDQDLATLENLNFLGKEVWDHLKSTSTQRNLTESQYSEFALLIKSLKEYAYQIQYRTVDPYFFTREGGRAGADSASTPFLNSSKDLRNKIHIYWQIKKTLTWNDLHSNLKQDYHTAVDLIFFQQRKVWFLSERNRFSTLTKK